MSVRKRTWKTKSGEPRSAWLVDYFDAQGKRQARSFAKKKDADSHHAKVAVDIAAGIHVPDSASVTVSEACELWLATGRNNGLERSTLEQYEAHARLHINPFLGSVKLSRLTAPGVRALEDRLREEGRSQVLTRYVVRSLSQMLGDAMQRGLVAQNVARAHRVRRAERHREPVTIPTPAEVSALLANASPRWRPLLMVAAFCGLRSSEIRGLTWASVDLSAGKLTVAQRADRWGQIGPPKSAASRRTLPMPEPLVRALREWKMACPPSELDLVFPTREGRVLHLSVMREGTGFNRLHDLRHWYASWLINPRNLGRARIAAENR